MKRLLLILFMLINSTYGFNITFDATNGDDNKTVTVNKDYIRVQVPSEIKRDPSSVPSLKQAFICPTTKIQTLNKKTKVIIKSEMMSAYESVKISNIDYSNGAYTCSYYFNDKIEFSYRYKKNAYYIELLKKKEYEILSGVKILGFDYQKLNAEIEQIDESSLLNIDKIIDDIGLNNDYGTKGFETLSSLIVGTIGMDEDIITGTDVHGNIIFKQNGSTYTYNDTVMYDTSDELIKSNQKNDDSSVLGKDYDLSLWQKAMRYVGINNEIEAAAKNSDVLLNAVDNTSSFIDKSTLGNYHNFFLLSDMFMLYLILFSIISIKVSTMYGIDAVEAALTKRYEHLKRHKKTYFISVAAISSIVFLPIGETQLNGNKIGNDGATIGQNMLGSLASISTNISDEITYDLTKLRLKSVAKNAKIYDKSQLTTISRDIARSLNITSHQIGLLQICKDLYSFNGTFLNANDGLSYRNNKDEMIPLGVPSVKTCGNTEGNIYSNMQQIKADTSLLVEKIESIKSNNGELSEIEKSLTSTTHLIGSVVKDTGWIGGAAFLYTLPKFYENIALDIDSQKESNLETSIDSYFDKNGFVDNDSFMIDKGVDLVSVVSSYAFLHNFDMFSRTQQQLYSLMKPAPLNDEISEDWNYNAQEQAQSKTKNKIQKTKEKAQKAKKSAIKKIVGFVSKITPQGAAAALVDRMLTKTIAVTKEAGALVVSYMAAKVALIESLKLFKYAAVTSIVVLMSILYIKELILFIFFLPLFLFKFMRTLIKSEDSTAVSESLSKLIYVVAYPSFLVISVFLLWILESLLNHILSIVVAMEIQTMKLTAYSVSSSQSVIDSFGTKLESIMRIGMYGGISEIIQIFVVIILAWIVIKNMPDEMLDLIDPGSKNSNNTQSVDQVDSSRSTGGKV